MKYIVTSKAGMTPFATTSTLPQAIADSVRARRNGLDGRIIPDADSDMMARPTDCDEAAQILGWDRDPASADMDQPIDANIVASDLASN